MFAAKTVDDGPQQFVLLSRGAVLRESLKDWDEAAKGFGVS